MKEELLYTFARSAYTQICAKPYITRTELNHNLKTISDLTKNAALSRVISHMLQNDQIRKRFNPDDNSVIFWPSKMDGAPTGDPLRPFEEPVIDFLAPYTPKKVQTKKVEEPKSAPVEVKPPPAPTPVKTREEKLQQKREDHVKRKTLDETLYDLCEKNERRYTAQEGALAVGSMKKVVAIRFSYLGKHGKLRCRKNERGDMEYWHARWPFSVESLPLSLPPDHKSAAKATRSGDDILLWRTSGEQTVLNQEEYRALCRMYVEELLKTV